MSGALTLEGLLQAHDALRGVVYYGTSEGIERGKVIMVEASLGLPQAIYCHPDDFEALRKQIPQRLVNVRDWKPTNEDTLTWSSEMLLKIDPRERFRL